VEQNPEVEGASEGMGKKAVSAVGIPIFKGTLKRQEGSGAGDSERLHERRKALEGMNPKSGFGMK